MPVFWFALSFVDTIDLTRAIVVFLILHVLVYPSSNGYNSYMDRDEGSIGGLEKPMEPTRQLFMVTLLMDAVAIIASLYVSTLFAACIIVYITFSRLYSYRGIRLKRFPLIGYLTVIVCQGSLTFFMVYHGSDENLSVHMPSLGIIAAAFLIGGFYPITQVYQHQQDNNDGVTTISMKLGTKGTFVFCTIMYSFALFILWTYYSNHELYRSFIVLLIFFIPVIAYFGYWFSRVLKDESQANFKHTMQMNWLASVCTSLAFITIIVINRFG